MISINKFFVVALIASVLLSVASAQEQEAPAEAPKDGLASKIIGGIKRAGDAVMSRIKPYFQKDASAPAEAESEEQAAPAEGEEEAAPAEEQASEEQTADEQPAEEQVAEEQADAAPAEEAKAEEPKEEAKAEESKEEKSE